jgi:hypothetical protein
LEDESPVGSRAVQKDAAEFVITERAIFFQPSSGDRQQQETCLWRSLERMNWTVSPVGQLDASMRSRDGESTTFSISKIDGGLTDEPAGRLVH